MQSRNNIIHKSYCLNSAWAYRVWQKGLFCQNLVSNLSPDYKINVYMNWPIIFHFTHGKVMVHGR